MTGRQLKNSILQMAVQGKLVPQDPNDEPASVLLEHIRAEKEQLIKEGKIKKEKNPSYIFRGADNLPYEKIGNNEPVCIADEVPFDIPDSWEWVRLGNISTYADTKKKINAQDAPKNMWGLDLEDIEKGGKLLERKTVGSRNAKGDKTFFSKGDILYSKLRPYLLKILVAPDDGICTSEIVPFKMYGNILSEYIVMYLKSPSVDFLINSITYGVKMPRVGTETMINLLMPIPPINEQKSIMTLLNKVTPYINNYSTIETASLALSKSFPDQLKKSILQQAVMGKLVQQDENDEPASALLERIRAEKQQLIKAGKIKKDKHESVIFKRDNSHYEKLDGIERCIDDEIPFEIPDNWAWTRLNNIIILTSGQDLTPEKYNSVMKGIPYITGASNIEDEIVIINRWTEYPKSLAYKGDLLLTCKGTVGAMAFLEEEKAHIARQIMSISSTAYIDLSYIQILLKVYIPQLKSSAKSMIPGIARNDVLSLLAPIPPLAEQHRIVEQIEKILPTIKKL